MDIQRLIGGVLTVACISLAGLQVKAQSTDNDPAAATGTGSGNIFGQVLNEQVGSMRFMGKVVVEGGKLPWDPIPVAVICDGKTRYYTLTDKKGEFDIAATPTESLGVRSTRDPKHVDPAQLVGCKVTALLDGFTSTTVTIMNGSIMDNPDLGKIILRQDPGATGSIVSATTLSAPDEARKEADKARSDEADRNPGSARRHLEKAVSIDPQFAEAWYQLGKLEEADKPQDALSAFVKATAADPKFVPPYEHIAALAGTEKKWQEMADAANHALQLNPAGTPQIWYFSAVANYNLGKRSVAETAALSALSLDPSHKVAPNTEQLLAVILAGRGDVKGALEHLRNCLTYTPPGANADQMKQQVAQLEKAAKQPAK
jgi:hypothetical protein